MNHGLEPLELSLHLVGAGRQFWKMVLPLCICVSGRATCDQGRAGNSHSNTRHELSIKVHLPKDAPCFPLRKDDLRTD